MTKAKEAGQEQHDAGISQAGISQAGISQAGISTGKSALESKANQPVNPVAIQMSSQQASKPASELSSILADSEGVDLDGLSEAMDQIDDAIYENVGNLQVSRIAISQPGTPEVAAGEEGWKAGILFDNMTKEIFSKVRKATWIKTESPPMISYAIFLPIFALPTEFVAWPTKEERQEGMKNYHWKSLQISDARVQAGIWPPKGKWKGTGSPPVTEHKNLLGIILNEDGTPMSGHIVLSCSRTSFRSGEKLMGQCLQHKMNNLPNFWGRVYFLMTEKKLNASTNNTYYQLSFAKGPSISEFIQDKTHLRAIVEECFQLQKDLSDKSIDSGQESTKGRLMQERFINAAALQQDDESGDERTDTVMKGGSQDVEF